MVFPCLWGQSGDEVTYESKEKAVWSHREWCSAHPSWFSQDFPELQLCLPDTVCYWYEWIVLLIYDSCNWPWLETWPHLLWGHRSWVFPKKFFWHGFKLPPLRWHHSDGPQAAGDYILWWSEWGKHLYGTCVVICPPHWTLVDRLLVCRSCSIWQPHHCQRCGWWQQHWLVLIELHCWTSFSATFFSAFSCLFSSFLLSFSPPPSTCTSGLSHFSRGSNRKGGIFIFKSQLD